MDIIWETHQYGNKSQRLLLFIFMHVSRVTSSAPESAMKETCVPRGTKFLFCHVNNCGWKINKLVHS